MTREAMSQQPQPHPVLTCVMFVENESSRLWGFPPHSRPLISTALARPVANSVELAG